MQIQRFLDVSRSLYQLKISVRPKWFRKALSASLLNLRFRRSSVKKHARDAREAGLWLCNNHLCLRANDSSPDPALSLPWTITTRASNSVPVSSRSRELVLKRGDDQMGIVIPCKIFATFQKFLSLVTGTHIVNELTSWLKWPQGTKRYGRKSLAISTCTSEKRFRSPSSETN